MTGDNWIDVGASAELASKPVQEIHVGSKRIALTHKGGEFGAISGAFVAPRDRLMGRMTITVPGEGGGAVAFNVEEYKRPKFAVTLEKPRAPGRLGEEAIARGSAIGYTGAPVGGAWQLAQAWPDAALVVVSGAGHATGDAGMSEAIRAATDRFAGLP